MDDAPVATRRSMAVGLALATALGAGLVATVFAAIVLLVARAASDFLDRVDLVGPAVLAEWEGRITWFLAFVVVAITIRAGVVLAAPDVTAGRIWGAVLAGVGAGVLLVSSPFWPAAAVGVGWGLGIGRTPIEWGAAGAIGVAVALFGFAAEVTSLVDAVVSGFVAAAIVALLLAVADLVRGRVRPTDDA